jgi:hypothetical protein
MNRNSTTVYIESPSGDIDKPCITPIPWINNVPDFTGITEPTLSVLKDAYHRCKGDIVIVPDPVDTSEPVKVREIDARRLRLALLQLGSLDTVIAAVNNLGEAAKIEWEYATVIREDSPLAQSIKTQLKLDTDAIITLALSLT